MLNYFVLDCFSVQSAMAIHGNIGAIFLHLEKFILAAGSCWCHLLSGTDFFLTRRHLSVRFCTNKWTRWLILCSIFFQSNQRWLHVEPSEVDWGGDGHRACHRRRTAVVANSIPATQNKTKSFKTSLPAICTTCSSTNACRTRTADTPARRTPTCTSARAQPRADLPACRAAPTSATPARVRWASTCARRRNSWCLSRSGGSRSTFPLLVNKIRRPLSGARKRDPNTACDLRIVFRKYIVFVYIYIYIYIYI